MNINRNWLTSLGNPPQNDQSRTLGPAPCSLKQTVSPARFLLQRPFLPETDSSDLVFDRAFFTQAYGTYSLLSFFYLCPHHSLKIPPKKRRRFSKSFRPLSHGSPLSLRVYKRYPEGLGEALYREQFDFNAEPPWDPS